MHTTENKMDMLFGKAIEYLQGEFATADFDLENAVNFFI